MKGEKGSITVFTALSLLLVTAALFALLEGTRLQELRRFANLQTELALESVFANYNAALWEEYHLLGTDRTQMEQYLEQIANGRKGDGTNLFRLRAEEMKMREDIRMTDAEGKVFIKSVATYMSDNWIYETSKEIYNQYEAIKHLMESSDMDRGNITAALEEVENAQKQERNRFTQQPQERKLDVVKLLETIEQWQQYGILQLVIKDAGALSTKALNLQNGLLNRMLQKGTYISEEEISWQEKLLFQQYLMTYLSQFQEEKETHALEYEIEYLLGNQSSDIENLKIVATEILAIREAANFMYLISNPSKIAKVESAAALVGATSLNPILAEVLKVGLLTAWAFAESVLDVRALLSGKRIPLLKSDETWTTELENIGEVLNGYPMAKESTWGMDYKSYLRVLLLMHNEQEIAMRAMNVQEGTIREIYQDNTFCLDELLVAVSMEITYGYNPVFPFLEVIDAEKRWKYQVLGKESYGYY